MERPSPTRPPRRPQNDNAHNSPAGRRPRLFASLLSTDQAAALDLQQVAFDAATNSTATYNVSIYMKPAREVEQGEGGASRNVARLTLGFPRFDTLHYDPTLSVEPAADLGYTANATELAATTTVQNAARSARGGAWAGAHALLGAAMLLVML